MNMIIDLELSHLEVYIKLVVIDTQIHIQSWIYHGLFIDKLYVLLKFFFYLFAPPHHQFVWLCWVLVVAFGVLIAAHGI